jgi:mRNA interferase MazF
MQTKTMKLSPGMVVTVDFPGAAGVKRRPSVIVSTDLYHRTRPDLIIGVLTSQLAAAVSPTDYLLIDWALAGLRLPTAFRAYLATVPQSAVVNIGQLSEQDWQEVRRRVALAIAVR